MSARSQQWRDRARVACRWWLPVAVALALASGARAGIHERGRLMFSIGGSVAHSVNKEKRTQGASQVVFDDMVVELEPIQEEEEYTDLDLSLFLSSGYMVVDHVEFGLMGSIMMTGYSGTDREDYELRDTQVYGKYYFDNPSAITPYLKLHGCLSTMGTGDYNEDNRVGGVVAGLESYGLGPMAWFVELSSQYTDLSGNRTGFEWRNQVYLGVSFYLNLSRPSALPLPEPAPGDLLGTLPPDTRRQILQADQEWADELRAIDGRTPAGDEHGP